MVPASCLGLVAKTQNIKTDFRIYNGQRRKGGKKLTFESLGAFTSKDFYRVVQTIYLASTETPSSFSKGKAT
jgi:hypothetical protein